MPDAPLTPSDAPVTRRHARRLWRKTLLERAAAGESRPKLAAQENVSLSTVQHALTRARAEHPVESRETFAAIQRDRLEKAVALAEARIEQGDLAAAYVMIQLMPLLERFDERRRDYATPDPPGESFGF